MKKSILILVVATLLVSSCSQVDGISIPETEFMHISAFHPALTRATVNGFESGDEIGVFVTDYIDDVAAPLQISGNWANNVIATYDGAAWSTDKKIFWSENKMDVYGYYPYMNPISIDEQPFAVALDQSTESTDTELGGYEASDFLWAKATSVSKTNETVDLEFKHCCSKLIVKLIKGKDYMGDFPTNASLYIHNVVHTATIDFTTGTVVKDIFGEPTTIKARKVADDTYEAIIIPQRVTSRRPFIELIAGKVSYLLEDIFYFKAGVQHTISLTIDSNPDQIKVDIGGEIEGGW